MLSWVRLAPWVKCKAHAFAQGWAKDFAPLRTSFLRDNSASMQEESSDHSSNLLAPCWLMGLGTEDQCQFVALQPGQQLIWFQAPLNVSLRISSSPCGISPHIEHRYQNIMILRSQAPTWKECWITDFKMDYQIHIFQSQVRQDWCTEERQWFLDLMYKSNGNRKLRKLSNELISEDTCHLAPRKIRFL